jgi:hypothetical protein
MTTSLRARRGWQLASRMHRWKGRRCCAGRAFLCIIALRKENLFGRRVVEGWERGWLRVSCEELEVRRWVSNVLESLVLSEGRGHFSRAVVAVRVDFRLRRQIALPCLAPRFRVEVVAQHHDLPSTVPIRRHDDAVTVECFRLVDERERVTHWCRRTVERAVGGRAGGRNKAWRAWCRTLSVAGNGRDLRRLLHHENE